MTNFNEIKYKRLDYNQIKEEVESLTKKLKNVKDVKTFLELFKQINLIQLRIEEYADYADIRNMRNDSDEFFQKEMEYWNTFKSKFDLLFMDFYQICLTTPFKEEIKNLIPDNFFYSIDYKNRTSSKEILELQKRDNELKSQYRKIMNKKCKFRNEEHNLSYVTKFFSSSNREERKEVHDAYNDFFIENREEFDHIFLEMVQVRNQIAKILGFNNYSEMSTLLLRRFGYGYNEIKIFRENIQKYITELVSEIREMQKQELGLEQLTYYDTVFYKEEPKLLYTEIELLEKMHEIFVNMDSELGNFYYDMLNNGYIDLLNSDNKIKFFITNYLSLSSLPTITGNFNGKYSDLTALTHESGHSFQKYFAGIEDKNHIVSPLLKYPTFEIAEMFSYAIQLTTLNYVQDLFSESDYKKYAFLVIKDLITTMPYIATVDEFQEQVYSKENISISEIKEIWKQLCNKYNLKNHITGHPTLENGEFFYRQNHIFLNPFYYIDYAISYFGAFAIWQQSSKDLDTFKKMSAIASYLPLNELVAKFNLANPFEEKSMKHLSLFLKQQLNKFKQK